MKRQFLTAILIAGAGLVHAQSALETPQIPSQVYRGERVEPEVTIVETGEAVIYEYRVGGQLYMARVQPVLGPAYYLLDTNNDGELDVRSDRPWNDSINQWLLMQW